MALSPSHPASITTSHPIVLSLLLAIILMAAVLLLTALFGIDASGPSIEIVPDPAGTMLPF